MLSWLLEKLLFLGFVVFDMKSILQPSSHQSSTIALPFIEPTESVTWQHNKMSARFHLGDSIHRVKLPKVLLTGMHSNAISKHHSGLLSLLFVDPKNSSCNSKTSALRETSWTLQQAETKGRFDWN